MQELVTIATDYTKEMNEFLEGQLSQGNRWVAYAPFNEPYKMEELLFFSSAFDAKDYCDENGTEEWQTYETIQDFKTQFQTDRQVSHHVSHVELTADLKKYGFRVYIGVWDQFIQRIWDGKCCPVICTKQIIPAEEIMLYHVFDHTYPQGMIYEVGHRRKLLGSFSDYDNAKTLLEEQTLKLDLTEADSREFVLMGQYRDHYLNLNYEGVPQRNSGIILSIGTPEYKFQNNFHPAEIRQFVDPYKKNGIDYLAFMQLDLNAGLALYNDKLERIEVLATEIDLENSQDLTPYFKNKQPSVMNYENFQFLEEIAIHVGLTSDPAFLEKLEQHLLRGDKEFEINSEHQINGKKVSALSSFRLSDKSDMHFFNRYKETLHTSDNPVENLSQTFLIRRGKGISLNEGLNLLEGRSVYKEMYPEEGPKYYAWLKLDFENKDQYGNYKINQYGKNYGDDMEKGMSVYSFVEMENEKTKRPFLDSVKEGNLTEATFRRGDKTERQFVFYDGQFKKVKRITPERVNGTNLKNNTDEFRQNQQQGDDPGKKNSNRIR